MSVTYELTVRVRHRNSQGVPSLEWGHALAETLCGAVVNKTDAGDDDVTIELASVEPVKRPR
jgi:hypothetical protein